MKNIAAAAVLVLLSSTARTAPGDVAPLAVVRYQTVDKLIFLPVRVDGSRRLTFVLDSGAPHTVVDSTAAVELKLREVSADRTWQPRPVGNGNTNERDDRELSIAVCNIQIR